MIDFLMLLACVLTRLFRSRARLEAEILVLRHQLNILQRKSTERASFKSIDRLVFAGLYRLVPGVLDALKNLKPETVPSTRYRPRDFEETSSILGMADAFLAPCTWQRWFARHRCRA